MSIPDTAAPCPAPGAADGSIAFAETRDGAEVTLAPGRSLIVGGVPGYGGTTVLRVIVTAAARAGTDVIAVDPRAREVTRMTDGRMEVHRAGSPEDLPRVLLGAFRGICRDRSRALLVVVDDADRMDPPPSPDSVAAAAELRRHAELLALSGTGSFVTRAQVPGARPRSGLPGAARDRAGVLLLGPSRHLTAAFRHPDGAPEVRAGAARGAGLYEPPASDGEDGNSPVPVLARYAPPGDGTLSGLCRDTLSALNARKDAR